MRQRTWWSSPERWLPVEYNRASALAPRALGRLDRWSALLVLALVAAIVALSASARRSACRRRSDLPPNGSIRLVRRTATSIVSEADGVEPARPDQRARRGTSARGTRHDGTTIRASCGDDRATASRSMMIWRTPTARTSRQLLDGAARPASTGSTGRRRTTASRSSTASTGDGSLSILDVATAVGLDRIDRAGASRRRHATSLWRPPDGDELIFTRSRRTRDASTGAASTRSARTAAAFRTVVPERTEDWPYPRSRSCRPTAGR